jgi:hypothetical protein
MAGASVYSNVDVDVPIYTSLVPGADGHLMGVENPLNPRAFFQSIGNEIACGPGYGLNGITKDAYANGAIIRTKFSGTKLTIV